MARIFITTTAIKTKWEPYALSNYERISRAARRSKSQRHSIATDVFDADYILFIGSRYKFHWDILRSEIYKTHRAKCIIFDFQDNTIPRIPGLYMQIPASLQNKAIYETGFYPRVFDNAVLKIDEAFCQSDYLFSFVGRVENSIAVRRRVMEINHPRACIEDRNSRQSDNDVFYANILAKSKFVLCPRGKGPSTWRLFEVMRSGRVPVIISDEWIEPKGLDWSSFSVRVREKDIDKIPRFLERIEDRAEQMGSSARIAWNKNFSEEGSFEWIAQACERIKSVSDRENSRTIISESLRPLYRKHFYREIAALALKSIKV
jgi:hypothetical protein